MRESRGDRRSSATTLVTPVVFKRSNTLNPVVRLDFRVGQREPRSRHRRKRSPFSPELRAGLREGPLFGAGEVTSHRPVGRAAEQELQDSAD